MPMSDEREQEREKEAAAVARTAVIAVTLFILVAGVLGLVTGSFTIEHFKPTVPPKSNPITVP